MSQGGTGDKEEKEGAKKMTVMENKVKGGTGDERRNSEKMTVMQEDNGRSEERRRRKVNRVHDGED